MSAWGLTVPSSVLKTMSTTASSGKGLRARRTSPASRVVTPSAKYHDDDADDAHDATLSPMAPAVATSATASPPSSSMRAEANVAVTTSARRTAVRPEGPTAIGARRMSPFSGKTVSVPVSRRLPALAMTTEPSPRARRRPAPLGSTRPRTGPTPGAATGTWALMELAPSVDARSTRRSTTPPAMSRPASTAIAGRRGVRGPRAALGEDGSAPAAGRRRFSAPPAPSHRAPAAVRIGISWVSSSRGAGRARERHRRLAAQAHSRNGSTARGHRYSGVR